MKEEGIRGSRPSYNGDLTVLRTSVGGAQAAIEFKFFEFKKVQCTIFHVNCHGLATTRNYETQR